MRNKKIKGSKEISSESEIVQKKSSNYPTRYPKEPSREERVIEKNYNPSYKSRYK